MTSLRADDAITRANNGGCSNIILSLDNTLSCLLEIVRQETQMGYGEQLHNLDYARENLAFIQNIAPGINELESREVFRFAILFTREIEKAFPETQDDQLVRVGRLVKPHNQELVQKISRILASHEEKIANIRAAAQTMHAFRHHAEQEHLPSTPTEKSILPVASSIKIKYEVTDEEFVFKFYTTDDRPLKVLNPKRDVLYGRMLYAIFAYGQNGLNLKQIKEWVYPNEEVTKGSVQSFYRKSRQLVLDTQRVFTKYGIPGEILVLTGTGDSFSVHWNARECLSLEEAMTRSLRFKEIQSDDPELIARRSKSSRKP